MKLIWNNIDNIYLTRNNTFAINKKTAYIYTCEECGDIFTGRKNTVICSKCSVIGAKNPFFGKKHSEKTRNIISKNRKGKCVGLEHKFYGKHHSKKTIEKMSGKNHKLRYEKGGYPNFQGGYCTDNIPTYLTYAHQLNPYGVDCRRSPKDNNILEVKCDYCEGWFIPKKTDVSNRIQSIKGNYIGENRLYCSDDCKQNCPVFGQQKSRKGEKTYISRNDQAALKELVLEKYGHVCEKCGEEANLICHHITGVEINPVESADIDNCVVFCENCHNGIHKQNGCGYHEMIKKECK
jgi:hypothetical protein